MPNVGDPVQVRVSRALSGGNARFSIAPDVSAFIRGTISADLGDRWQVRLGMAVGGKNLVEVPK